MCNQMQCSVPASGFYKLGTYNWTNNCALYYIGFVPFKYKRLLNLEMKFAVLDHELMITLK